MYLTAVDIPMKAPTQGTKRRCASFTEWITIPPMDTETNTPIGQKIVIVEDNAALAEIYKTRLELLGYICFIGYNGITGLYFIQKEMPDLVLLDLMIPDIPGNQVLRTLRESDWGKEIKVLIVSNLNESEAAHDLRQLGIEGYLVKANMIEDTIDQEVNKILRPNAQPAQATTQA
jgi:DNA-binding response OmpR family regulator